MADKSAFTEVAWSFDKFLFSYSVICSVKWPISDSLVVLWWRMLVREHWRTAFSHEESARTT